ncbi:MAG: hypothetical protein QXG78_04130, partial [Candidatus Methanomethyliaceae archaeon]
KKSRENILAKIQPKVVEVKPEQPPTTSDKKLVALSAAIASYIQSKPSSQTSLSPWVLSGRIGNAR